LFEKSKTPSFAHKRALSTSKILVNRKIDLRFFLEIDRLRSKIRHFLYFQTSLKTLKRTGRSL